jgi:hypothetical protein
MAWQLRFAALGSMLTLIACAANPHRAAPSSYGCMLAVRDALPQGISDKRAHCLAAGGIAEHCSVFEANLAGIGKEFRDVFAHGDPSWADWQADRAGIRCERAGQGGDALAACCAGAGY